MLQATAVWPSTGQAAPEARAYKSAELVSELRLALHDFILLRTGDIRYTIETGTKKHIARLH